ncbi:MAG: SUMF1/EgtB/PvdO family nonheme iron enzyme [Thermoguttaceae bacterium]|jgi:formylglycine-generating enzyme required for sulfatase activity
MKDQPLLRFAFACAVFVLALSTEIRAEGTYLIPGDFGWRRSLPLEVLFACRFFPADRYGRVTGEFILDPNVVEDLGLSADVAHELLRLHNQIRMEVNEERHRPPKDDPNKPPPDKQPYDEHTVRKRHMKELNQLLTPQQQERLYQIHIQRQRRFTDALSDPGVAKAIGLTDAQRSQIYQLHWEVSHAEHLESGEKSTGDYTGPSSDALYKACPEKIMKILSDDQRQKFEKLKGASLLRAQGKPAEAEAGPLQRLPGARMLAEGCWKASFSPDGNRIVVGKMPEDSGLRIVDLTTGTNSDLLPYGKDPAWSPGDGRLIAFEHRGDEGDEVWIVEASGANPRKLAHGGFPSWSPDAKSIYFQSRKQHRLQVIALGAKGANATDVMDMAFLYPSVSPDGRQVAYRSGNQLIIADLKTGKAAKTFPIDGGRGFAAGWSPDGKQIGYGGWGGGDPVPFSIVDIAAGRTVLFPNIRGTMPAWSPDGSKMVFDVRTQRDRDIWLVETKALETLSSAEPNSGKDSKPSQDVKATQEPEAANKPKRQFKELTVDLGGGVKLELILIPAGEFKMGDEQGWGWEKPAHKVTITAPFYLGKYEVTQEQWKAVMGNNPSHFQGPKNPVDSVSWEACQDFLARLNAKLAADGAKFSLPTEAQWEYACRAGTMTRYSFGDDPYADKLDDYAWWGMNAANHTHPVGQKKPNAWGLYDMHGNVFEWFADRWSEDYYRKSPGEDPKGPSSGSSHGLRGGSWSLDDPRIFRCAFRYPHTPNARLDNYGFRVARTP